MLTANSGTPYRKLIVPSSGSMTHCSRAPAAVLPPSSPKMPAPGVAASRTLLKSSSARRSVCVTMSVGDDLCPTARGCPYADVTTSAAARAAVDATSSSSGGAGSSARSDTVDRDGVSRQGGSGLGIHPRVGHEHVDLVECGEAEHLNVSELGVVDHGDHPPGALDHRSFDRVLLAIRRGQPVLERQH